MGTFRNGDRLRPSGRCCWLGIRHGLGNRHIESRSPQHWAAAANGNCEQYKRQHQEAEGLPVVRGIGRNRGTRVAIRLNRTAGKRFAIKLENGAPAREGSRARFRPASRGGCGCSPRGLFRCCRSDRGRRWPPRLGLLFLLLLHGRQADRGRARRMPKQFCELYAATRSMFNIISYLPNADYSLYSENYSSCSIALIVPGAAPLARSSRKDVSPALLASLRPSPPRIRR